ncbi:MAG: DUF4159 domain-containing protein, partial [Candidatus Latescibacterota bacterium]
PRSAIVVVDYSDKQNIKGRMSLALAWGELFSPPQEYLRGFIHLREAMIRWTKIETTLERHLMLSSPRLLEMPFIYVTSEENFDLTDSEKANIKKYLEGGGFMVIENPNPLIESGPGEASLKQMIRDSLGRNVRFAPIPKDHPLYHCFFDFNDGPPIGAEIGATTEKRLPRPIHYLEGVWLRERLVVVFSNKGYIVKWTQMENNIPQLKMGVNMVVFSLLQEGGVAIKQ